MNSQSLNNVWGLAIYLMIFPWNCYLSQVWRLGLPFVAPVTKGTFSAEPSWDRHRQLGEDPWRRSHRKTAPFHSRSPPFWPLELSENHSKHAESTQGLFSNAVSKPPSAVRQRTPERSASRLENPRYLTRDNTWTLRAPRGWPERGM